MAAATAVRVYSKATAAFLCAHWDQRCCRRLTIARDSSTAVATPESEYPLMSQSDFVGHHFVARVLPEENER